MSGITDGVDFDGIDAATAEAINKAIESGDLDAMNALLNGASVSDIEKDEFETGEESAASGEADSEKSGEVDQSETEEEEEEPVVVTKDGKRTIPFEVLEDAREQRNKYAAENRELKEKLSAHESKSQKLEKYLSEKGIDLNSISDAQAENLSTEDLAQLDELDPVLGKAIRLLSQNVAKTQQAIPQESEVPPDVLALRGNADLMDWMKNDPKRYAEAEAIDDRLKDLPEFKGLSYAERFAEVVRRTKIAFGDEAPAKQSAPQKTKQQIGEIASKKIDEAMRSSVPRSLSNLGTTPNSERSSIELLAEKDPADLLEAMSKMHPDKLMEALGQIE